MNTCTLGEILAILLVWQVLIFAAIFMGIHHSTGSFPKKIIGWFMLANAGYFGITWMANFGHIEVLRFVYPFASPLLLLHLPFFYWYIRSLTESDFRIKATDWFHLLPAIVVLLLQLSFFLLPAILIDQFLQNEPLSGEYSYMFLFLTGLDQISFYAILPAQFFFYFLKYRTIILAYRNRIGNIFSYTENVDLKWIRNLLIGILFFFMGNELSRIIGVKVDGFSSLFFSLGMIAINFYLGYHSLIQRKEVLKAYYSGLAIDEIPQAAIFTVATVETKVSGDLDSRYKRSSLKAESRINIIQQLNRLMQEEELFTDTKLCIDDVALRLSINSKYLSQSINEEYNRNFYVYVNELRVEKAKTYLVAEPQANYSIEGIARQVGFQSKSSFYIAFRRSTGLTPTAYRAQA